MLLTKEEGVIDRVVETGRDYEIEVNVDKSKVMRISRREEPLRNKN